jgi:nucleoside-diphosphate-sugar epimerase
MRTDRILLTGAAGWLGVNLVRALLEGLEGYPELHHLCPRPHLVCLVPPGLDAGALEGHGGAVTVVRGDLRNPGDCTGFCAGARGALLLHTAGVIHPPGVSAFYEVNVRGAGHLLEAAAAAGLRRVVAVSSNSVCGVNPHPDHLFDEDSPPRPYMHYGRSKLLMERLVREYHEAGRLEAVIVRCPWFYGPNQPGRQALFFRMIRDGTVPVVGDGTNRRSMVFVDNLCQGVLRAAFTPAAAGRLYWVADPTPYAMNEIISTIEQLLEEEFGQACARRRVRLPWFVSELALLADRCLQGLGLYNAKLHVLSEMNKTIACSVARAWRELGYRPQVALAEGMRRSLRCAFDRGMLP